MIVSAILGSFLVKKYLTDHVPLETLSNENTQVVYATAAAIILP